MTTLDATRAKPQGGEKNKAQGVSPGLKTAERLSPKGAKEKPALELGLLRGSHGNRLILHVSALEIGNPMVALKMPDTGRYLVNQVFVVCT